MSSPPSAPGPLPPSSSGSSPAGEARVAARAAIAHHATRLGLIGISLDQLVDTVLAAAEPHLHREHVQPLVEAHARQLTRLQAAGLNVLEQLTDARNQVPPLRAQLDAALEQNRNLTLSAQAAHHEALRLRGWLERIEGLPYTGPEPTARLHAREALGR